MSEYGFSYVANARAENEATARLSAEAAKSGSWLMAMAVILGELADKMMANVVKKAEELDSASSGKGSPGSESENKLTAELQAQTQLLNMFMQAMSTVIKTAGEANSQVARKTG
ncbi:hypothetical protein [Luteimonas sp. R10]|uniref:hypothetical protein n=1 Tax=Luteimonas sp. R10 TaxID=3108176 RepID=UPI00308B1C5F|nr:hypothetical protein U3649_01945 [Luteimonas sp. R10]